jgi:hypothetical protein
VRSQNTSPKRSIPRHSATIRTTSGVVAAEDAREAGPVELDALKHLAALAHPPAGGLVLVNLRAPLPVSPASQSARSVVLPNPGGADTRITYEWAPRSRRSVNPGRATRPRRPVGTQSLLSSSGLARTVFASPPTISRSRVGLPSANRSSAEWRWLYEIRPHQNAALRVRAALGHGWAGGASAVRQTCYVPIYAARSRSIVGGLTAAGPT